MIPAEFAALLKQSWDERGLKLTDYRDFGCTSRLSLAKGRHGMDRYDGRWGTSVGLPTDPTAKSLGGL